MTKVSDKDLILLYRHLSMQSVMDIKEVFGEVSMRVMEKLNGDCLRSFSIFNGRDILCGCFVYDAEGTYNLIVYPSTKFSHNKDICKEAIKEQLKLLKDRETNSIIHSGANQVMSMLYSIGFVPAKRVARNGYRVLELLRNE